MANEVISFGTTDIKTLVDQIMKIYASFDIDLSLLDNDKFNVAVNDTIAIATAILTCNRNLVEATIQQMLPMRSVFIDRKTHQEICYQILVLADKHRREHVPENFY